MISRKMGREDNLKLLVKATHACRGAYVNLLEPGAGLLATSSGRRPQPRHRLQQAGRFFLYCFFFPRGRDTAGPKDARSVGCTFFSCMKRLLPDAKSKNRNEN